MSTETPPICFLDIESGGLRPSDDHPWEVGIIRRDSAGAETEHLFHIADFAPAKADPKALEKCGFYDRHPLHCIEPDRASLAVVGSSLDVAVEHLLLLESAASRRIERLVRGALTVFCNPTYDVPRLTAMLGRTGYAWTGHYRALCATTYAAGIAAGIGLPIGPAPWSNKAVGELFGVVNLNAHTALADAVYARDLWDAATVAANEKATLA